VPDDRPKIWAEGKQRPPFVWRAFARSGLYLSREGVAPLAAWSAHTTRRVAVNVKNGVGRIPEARLGRVARFVPSHLRVAGWIKNLATVLAHASANADPDARRGNALVAEIEPHLWEVETPTPEPPPAAPEATAPLPYPEPVVLPEPQPVEADPLAAIRDDLAEAPAPGRRQRPRPAPPGPAEPPAPPGPVANMAIQVLGYLAGWALVILALPYGLGRALWLWFKGSDLRGIGREG
jgi:hypothetical protein